MFNPKLWAVLQERHRDLKERGSSGSSEQATDSPRSAARAFHVLPVLLKNDLWKVLLQDLIKNKVISKLLVYLVVLVGAPIGGVTVGLFSTCPAVTEEYHVKIFMPVCQEKQVFAQAILIWLLTMKWKIDDVFWSSTLNPLHLAIQFNWSRGPHLCSVPKLGSLMLNRCIVLQTCWVSALISESPS